MLEVSQCMYVCVGVYSHCRRVLFVDVLLRGWVGAWLRAWLRGCVVEPVAWVVVT